MDQVSIFDGLAIGPWYIGTMPHLEHNGANLYYELHGTAGEPVLFIQGIGVTGRGWKPQLEGLTPHHRALVFDNRGIGQSTGAVGRLSIEAMAEDAKALMDAVGWAQCHVVGHSMGGVIAQRLAIAHRQAVRSLTLLCTVANGAEATRMTGQILLLGIRTRLGTRAMRRRAFLDMIYPRAYLDNLDAAGVVRLAQALGSLFGRDLADSPPILMQQMQALRRHSCVTDLAALQDLPTLVVSATHDPIAPPRFGRKLSGCIAGARFEEITDASHAVPVQQAERINGMIAGFIAASAIRS